MCCTVELERMLKLWKRIRLAGGTTSIAAFIIARWGHLPDNRVLAALIAVFITYHIFLASLVLTRTSSTG
jgi:hypothetical protein